MIGLSLRRTVQRTLQRRASATAVPVRATKRTMGIMVVGKMLALPMLTVSLLWLFAPELDAMWFNTAVLMAAMPTSATAYIMAQNDTGDGESTALAIVITCALSVVVLPVLAQLVLK